MGLWESTIEFHGHACCVLAVGYRAAVLAKEILAPLQEEERLQAIAETVDCSTDALQVVLRCTMGSRRLRTNERGKYVFTVARPGKAVRLALKPLVIGRFGSEFIELMESVANGTASPGEKHHFFYRQQPLIQYILEAPNEDLFNWREVNFGPMEPGFVFASCICNGCGEEVFEKFAVARQGKHFCPDCAGDAKAQPGDIGYSPGR